MFYLLTSNKSKRNNNIYTVGYELIKKVDLILNSKNLNDLDSNLLNSDIKNNNYNTKVDNYVFNKLK